MVQLLQQTEFDLAKLRQMIVSYFDENELRDLTFDLQIDYDSLEAIGKSGKARELVATCQRQEKIGRLLDTCREYRPKAAWQTVTIVLTDERPPFKGLSTFVEQDTDLFHGREAITSALLSRLASNLQNGQGAFLAVIGASGSGKSSVVQAGLLPVLKRGIPLPNGTRLDGSSWPIHIIKPSNTPVESLAVALTSEEDTTTTMRLIKTMQSEPRALSLYLQKQQQLSGHQYQLLVVDQFEEVFTLCDSEVERRVFIDNLLEATNGRFILILTLRADFYAQCAHYDNLRDALEQNQKFLGPMTTEELRRAIEKPSQREGYSFETGLIDTIIHEVGQEPGALPLLSHALLETWKRRNGKLLTFEGYQQAGGIRGAIAKTADSVYEYQLTSEQKTIARNIFISLTEIGEGTQDTRRRAPLSELLFPLKQITAIKEVLRLLTTARLVIVGEKTAEVAHEALIREWPTMRRWLDEDREGLRIHRQLAEDVALWVELDCDSGALYRGARLSHALEWANSHTREMTSEERRFLGVSREMEEKEIREREAQRQRELQTAQQLAQSERKRAEEQAIATKQQKATARLLKFGLVFAGALTLISIFLFYQADKQAEALQIANEETEQKTRAAEASALAAESFDIFFEFPRIGLLLAVEAINNLRPEDPRVPEVEEALRNALSHTGGELLELLDGQGTAATFSQNGRWLAMADDSGLIVLEAIEDETFEPHYLDDDAGPVFDLLFTPDGEWLISGGWDGALRMWGLDTVNETPFYIYTEGVGSTINAMSISGDGRWLMTGNDDTQAYLWDMTDLSIPIFTFAGHAGQITTVDISPDGRWAATGSDDGTVMLWNLQAILNNHEGQEPLQLQTMHGAVFSVAFSPNSRLLYTGGGTPPWVSENVTDHGIQAWQIYNLAEGPASYPAHDGPVTAIILNAEAEQLITSSWDKTVQIWELDDLHEERAVLRSHDEFVSDVAIDPEGHFLVSVSGDATAHLWDLIDPHSSVQVLNQPEGWVNSVAASHNQRWLAAGADDGVVYVWDRLELENPPLRLASPTAPITAVYFAKGTDLLIGISQNNLVYLWESPFSATAPLVLRGHENAISSVILAENGRFLATGDIEGNIYVRDLTSPSSVPIIFRSEDGAINALALTDDNKTLASGTTAGTIHLWDLQHISNSSRILASHGAAITTLDFDTTGNRLVSGSQDHTVQVWELQQLRRPLHIWQDHHDGIIEARFSPNDEWLISTSLDDTIRLWAVADFREPATVLRAHEGWVSVLAFSKNGRWLVTGGQDTNLKLWDLSDLSVGAVTLGGHEGQITAVTFSPDDRFLYTASSDQTVRAWTLSVDNLVLMACQAAGESLTEEEWQTYLPSKPFRDACEIALERIP